MTNLFIGMSASGGPFTDTYYLQSSAQRGSKVDAPAFFHVFPVGATFFPGWVQPPNPVNFSLGEGDPSVYFTNRTLLEINCFCKVLNC